MDADKRRKRVQTLKKLILGSILVMIVVPWIIVVILLIKINEQQQQINGLSVEVQRLMEISSRNEGTLASEASAESGLQSGTKTVEETVNGTTGGTEVGTTTESGFSTESSGVTDPDEDTIYEEAAYYEGTEPDVGMENDGIRRVYLTFDDGPSTNTDDILAILDEYGVKATFFVNGKDDDTSKDLIRRIADEGHSLGMHSYSHKYSSIYKSEDDFVQDYEAIRDYIYDITGETCKIYRFPGGSSNKVSRMDMNVFADYLDTQGVTFYDWNVSSGDASSGGISVENIIKNCTANLEKYHVAVILMHDAGGKKNTVKALPTIIENIMAMEDTEILPITEDTLPVQHIARE